MAEHAGRIWMQANQGATGALFGVAMIAYVMRVYVQLVVIRRFDIEDWIILFASACLVACTGLYYNHLGYIYAGLDISLNGPRGANPVEVLHSIPVKLKTDTVLLVLWWATIFAVKLGYLMFFRKLLFRLQGLMKWWWCVMMLTLAFFITNTVVSGVICPYSDQMEVVARCTTPPFFDKQFKIAVATTILDVVGDVFIVSIPIALLWRVRIPIRKKIGLGVALCLSTVMVIIAVVRASGVRLSNGTLDDVWTLFWLQQESSIAITMISITAFRSFFIVDHQSSADQASPRWLLNLSKIGSAVGRGLKFRFARTQSRRPADAHEGSSKDMMIRSKDPRIPSATITGMRTALDKAGNDEEEP